MIKINLLSNEERKKRLVNKKAGLIVRLGLSVVFALVILSLIMFSALIILEINLKSVKEETKKYPASSAKEVEETEDLLKGVNSVSKKIYEDSKNVPRWKKILDFFAAVCPEGLQITNIHIEKEHVKIAGFSKTREEFLNFQESLRKDYFKNLDSPVSNLVSPENFSFSLEFDVDKNYLSQP